MKFIKKFKATMKESDKDNFVIGCILGSILTTVIIGTQYAIGIIVFFQLIAYGYQLLKRKSHVESSNAFALIAGGNFGASIVIGVYCILTILFI